MRYGVYDMQVRDVLIRKDWQAVCEPVKMGEVSALSSSKALYQAKQLFPSVKHPAVEPIDVQANARV